MGIHYGYLENSLGQGSHKKTFVCLGSFRGCVSSWSLCKSHFGPGSFRRSCVGSRSSGGICIQVLSGGQLRASFKLIYMIRGAPKSFVVQDYEGGTVMSVRDHQEELCRMRVP